MAGFYEEINRIYRLKIPFDTVYTSVFLLEAEGGDILVDCAANDRDVDEFIIPALERMGKKLSDVRLLILTHRHSDHSGGMLRILSLAPKIEVITDIRDLCDGILTYPMAGHTMDCIGVFDTRSGTLISGDGLQGAGVDKYRCYTQSREDYLETVARIKGDERIKNILFSHAYEPWNKDGVLGRKEVCTCLEDCIECMGKEQITVILNGRPSRVLSGTVLSEIADGEKPCGGHGRCGKCKIIAKGCLSEITKIERELLSENELSVGVRLACLTYAIGDCEITTLSYQEKLNIVTDGILPKVNIRPDFEKYGVAIDIGTTTLAARLYDAAGNMLSDVSRLNPQQKWGADIISRIEASLGGKSRELALSIRQALDGIISELCGASGVASEEIGAVVITGNTVMLSLLTEQSVEPFSHAPFDVGRLFGETMTAEELELSALRPSASVYLPSCISAFVGADISCAILATELCGSESAMLVDIGTNGEMALWHQGRLTVCSTAAGPAFEGVDITMGMRGSIGAIDRVRVENGQFKAHVIGEGAPVGICGSGLVDAVACMLDEDIVDISGYLEDDEFIIDSPVYLTPKDIRMFQLAKGAICAGLVTLIESEGMQATDISTFYIAGGFGNYLNRRSAARIGLLPVDLAEASVVVGNAALSGASMLLLDPKMRERVASLAREALVYDLSTSRIFSDKYISCMMLEEI